MTKAELTESGPSSKSIQITPMNKVEVDLWRAAARNYIDLDKHVNVDLLKGSLINRSLRLLSPGQKIKANQEYFLAIESGKWAPMTLSTEITVSEAGNLAAIPIPMVPFSFETYEDKRCFDLYTQHVKSESPYANVLNTSSITPDILKNTESYTVTGTTFSFNQETGTNEENMTTPANNTNSVFSGILTNAAGAITVDLIVKTATRKLARALALAGKIDAAEMLLSKEGRSVAKTVVPAALLGWASVLSESDNESLASTAKNMIPALQAATAAGLAGVTLIMIEKWMDEDDDMDSIQNIIAAQKAEKEIDAHGPRPVISQKAL